MRIKKAKKTEAITIKSWTWILTVILATTAFRSAVADWNDVPTGSMRPTIIEGDRIFVNKLAYDLKIPFTGIRLAEWDRPGRGDIVTFYSPADGVRLVKRVIGLPGDTVAMRNNRLVINGEPVEYDISDVPEIDSGSYGCVGFYTENLPDVPHTVMVTPSLPAMRSFGPFTVPRDSCFMLGDNRDNSADSRYFGFVPLDSITGKVTGVAFSVQRDRYYLPRKGRFLERIR